MSLKAKLMEKIISFGRRAHSYGVNVPKEKLGASKFLNQNGHNSGLVQDRWNYFSIIKMETVNKTV